MTFTNYRWIFIGGVLIVLMVAAYLYYTYDPAKHSWFPQCPFKIVTGLECPGCGSQRAIHALLHGEFRQVFHYNALILPFISYLILGFAYRLVKRPSPQLLTWRKILFGEYAIKIITVVIFVYFIWRNMI